MVMICGLLLGSRGLCHAVSVEVTIFVVDQVTAFAVEQAAASTG